MLMRLKKNKILRNMCVNTTFLKDQLIQPIFVSENIESKKEIPGIPNNFVMNLEESIQQIELDLKNNQKNFLLFMIPKKKKIMILILIFKKMSYQQSKIDLKVIFYYGQMYVFVQ